MCSTSWSLSTGTPAIISELRGMKIPGHLAANIIGIHALWRYHFACLTRRVAIIIAH